MDFNINTATVLIKLDDFSCFDAELKERLLDLEANMGASCLSIDCRQLDACGRPISK